MRFLIHSSAAFLLACGAAPESTVQVVSPAATPTVTAAPSAPAEELTESFSTPNHVFTVRYPADFSASALDAATVTVKRSLPSGGSESIMFMSVTDLPSTDPRALVRRIVESSETQYRAKGVAYASESPRPAQCFGKYDGLAFDATLTPEGSAPIAETTCLFVSRGAAFYVSYDVTKSELASESALLERIERATEIALPEAAPAAAQDAGGANVTMAHIEADGLVIDDLACKVDGGVVGGLFGGIALAAGMKARKPQLDACSSSVVATHVSWVSSRGHMTHVHASGASRRVNECVERALGGASSPMDATCSATVHHGKRTASGSP